MIPELKKRKNFNQNNPWHVYDVYEHILHVVDGVPNDIVLRIAALFHDTGKPFSYTEDEKEIGHFYGHWNKSLEIFKKYSSNFNLDESKIERISYLIFYHDIHFDRIDKEELDLLKKRLGNEGIKQLFCLKKSDLLAQSSKYHYLLEDYVKQENELLNN